MRHAKRMGWLVAAVALVSVFLYGCGESRDVTGSEFPQTMETMQSQIVASNEQLSLKWDSEKFSVVLEQKETGKIWSSTPVDLNQEQELDEDIKSPIYIQYVDGVSMVSVTDKGYTDCVKDGRASVRKLERGIEITYYFDGSGISVPVQYNLNNDALEVLVDFANVKEKTNKLLSVSVAPFLCSAVNSVGDSYLVVPSGSGALMYLDEREEGVRTWSGEIYGEDPSRLLPEQLMENEAVRLPFFGVKDGNNALLAIVEDGDEAAYITANAGNKENGHSNAYITFYARGFDISEAQTAWAMSDVYRTEESINIENAKVSFYPMTGENADYVGMAMRYQQYLKEQGMLGSKSEEQSYALYITGGAQVKELVVGVPQRKTKALTTFEQAEEIIREVTEHTKEIPAVQLKGFGKSGLDAGKVAGGFNFASVFGSDEQRLSLEKYCQLQELPLFTDFDLVYFKNTGKGLNTLLDAAKSASSHKIKLYHKNKSLWHYDEEQPGYFLVGRKNLGSIVDTLDEVVQEKHISGVSLSTLGMVAYSDYSDSAYSARRNTEKDVQSALLQMKKSGVGVATESANSYATAVSDVVLKTAITHGGYIDLDVQIPLYQIIFKGYVALYSTAVNVVEDYDKAVLEAVSSGTSLGFSIVGEYNTEFSITPYTYLHASEYEGNREKMLETVSQCADYYAAIKGQTIVDYEYVTDSVSKTTFSNGVVVYANHENKKAEIPTGTLEAYEFSYTSEGN